MVQSWSIYVIENYVILDYLLNLSSIIKKLRYEHFLNVKRKLQRRMRTKERMCVRGNNMNGNNILYDFTNPVWTGLL